MHLYDFREPLNIKELSTFLNIDINLLHQARNDRLSFHSLFKVHLIPKRNFNRVSEFRMVWEANKKLSETYKSFARKFNLFLSHSLDDFPGISSYGYVKGRGTLDNASIHAGRPIILHADIKNFFPSISEKILKDKFLELGIKNEVSIILSKLLTIDGHLPLGLPTSPMLANLMCLRIDNKLRNLAEKYKCLYTRYADDISISGYSSIPQKEEIKKILNDEGFELSENKYKVTKTGQCHYVTGLSVNDSRYVRAPKKMKRELRKEIYYCKKFGIKKHFANVFPYKNYLNNNFLNNAVFLEFLREGVNRIDGTVRYVYNIEKRFWTDLKKDWEKLLQVNRLRPSYKSLQSNRNRGMVLYIDESEYSNQEILSLAIAEMNEEDEMQNSENTKSDLREYILNPCSDGKKEPLKKNGLHYVDSPGDLKSQYVARMSILSFKGYIAYTSCNCKKEEYEQKYLFLLKKMIRNRLMSCDGFQIKIIIEENGKVKGERIKSAIIEEYEFLKRDKDRSPCDIPDIIIGSKKDYPLFSIPDFLLGVFKNYAFSYPEKDDKHKIPSRVTNHFEKLRDKYKVIIDVDKNITYTRRRPFVAQCT